jgi:cell wall-associated NlpC family hydrolase
LRNSLRTLLAAQAVFAACATFAAVAPGAGARPATLQEAQSQLGHVRAQKAQVASTIEAANRQVDQLIGEESRLRQREAVVQQQLAARQAELDRATAELIQRQKELAALRVRLQRALGVLEKRLVAIYKADPPDVVSVALNSASWSDVLDESDYLDRIRQYDTNIAARVHALRDETQVAVNRLTVVRAQAQEARDAIAAQEHQLAQARAAVASQHAQLAAAQAQRQRLIGSLNLRERSLQGDVSKLAAASNTQIVGGPAPITSGPRATLSNGLASAPASAPAAVKGAIAAANSIRFKPYVWGGGHGSFDSPGYDCSGSVSFALHGGGLLSSPLDSTGLEFWGLPGPGRWITVYANSGHAWAAIAGLRWDTSGTGGNGPRWAADMNDGNGPFVLRHPPGL